MGSATKISTATMLSVLQKAETGPFVEEQDWDRLYIGKKIKELVKQYDIAWERPALGVPSDDALADRLFAAGLALAESSGVYCIDTRRQMRWSRAELEEVLANAPSQITIGEGANQATLAKRLPDDGRRVGVIGGAYGIPVPEELFVPVMLSYAQEPLIEFIENASLQTTYGQPIRANSPWDAVACWQEAALTFEVLRRAGRPGLAVGCANSSATAIGELSTTTYGGFRPTDWHHNSMMSELKVSYADLIKAAHFKYTGAFAHNFYNPILGGYPGGGDGVAVAIVAGMILLRAVLWGESFNPGPSHAHWSCNTTPEMIAAQAAAFQALNRNTHLLTSGFSRPVAGPGTLDIFYETAAVTIASVVSGVAFVKGVQSATGRFASHCTGLEARFMAQVAHAAEGLSRRQADPLVRKLEQMFQPTQAELRIGFPFEQLYDVESVQPRSHWLALYEQACQELSDLGLELSNG
jgi:methylamine--corrinoid protein Co-methyltransferase